MIEITRIPVKRVSDVYYLRWYYNGWHYWAFYPGANTYITEGEVYRTLGTKEVSLSSGQITGSQSKAIKTILSAKEVQVLSDVGWKSVHVLPGSSVIYGNVIDGYDIELVIRIGSRQLSVTGYSPVTTIPEITYDQDHIYIIITGSDITIILTGSGVVVIDWGDGTSTTVTLVDGVEQTITHTYTDGVSQHIISIDNPDVIDIIDLTDQNVNDVIIPDGNDVTVIVDTVNFTECVVVIGTQIWACKNADSNYPGSKVYNNDESNRTAYGALYTYDQVRNPGFCPAGSHVPTYQEVTRLIEFCGGESVAGGVLKKIGTTVWDSPNEGATDDYGFSAVGSGEAVIDIITRLPVFSELKSRGSLWLLYPEYPDYQWYLDINKDAAGVAIAAQPYTYLRAVRMLKNISFSEVYVDYDGNRYHVAYIGTQKWLIENLKVTHYNDGTAIPNLTDGTDWMNGTAGVTYDDWFLPSKDLVTEINTNVHLYGMGGFSGSLWSSSESSAANVWYFNFPSGSWGTTGKAQTTVNTRACRSFTADIGAYSLRDIGPAGGIICYIDGTTYYEVAASNQSNNKVWSNVVSTLIGTTSTAINESQNNTNEIIAQAGHTDSAAKLCDDLEITIGSITDGAFCWHNNNIANKTPYGALYNWHAVNNVKGLAPTGCRIATKADWDTLVAFLVGFNPGGMLKEIGTDHWFSPNEGATDTYKFKAVGASSRSGSTGNFGVLKQTTYFWTSTEHDSSDAEYSALTYINGYIGQSNMDKKYGLSVRCIVE